MIWAKYVWKENRTTNFYDVGTKWFNTHKIVRVKWFFNKMFVIVILKKLTNEKHRTKIFNRYR